ncbi:MAG TPA: CrcB family protein [Polyangiaceae bacterium]|jgi:CrcB protein|nr:CrcB family protein [Polyangiaceae bacterium]
MTRFLLVGLAGAVGTWARYLVGLGAMRVLGAGFPYGTLVVNLVGCFFIAAVVQTALTTTFISPTLNLTLTTGFLGGLTTYSSFNLQTTQLLTSRAWPAAAANFGATVVGCFLAGLLGVVVAKRAFGA